jgi:hypothetical protein
MKKILTTAFFFNVVGLLMAQVVAPKTNDGRVNLVTEGDRFQYINPFDNRTVAMQGTKYFLDSIYRPGELRTQKGLYTSELLYRFDQTERMVQVKTQSGKELYLNEYDVLDFKMFIGDRVVHFVPAAVPNGRKLTLLQVVYQSPTLQLLRDSRKYVLRVKSDNLDGYSSDIVFDEARKDYRYFMNVGTGIAFQEVKISPKSFVKMMPQKKSLITRLFKAGQAKEGLTLTKVAGIMKELDK